MVLDLNRAHLPVVHVATGWRKLESWNYPGDQPRVCWIYKCKAGIFLALQSTKGRPSRLAIPWTLVYEDRHWWTEVEMCCCKCKQNLLLHTLRPFVTWIFPHTGKMRSIRACCSITALVLGLHGAMRMPWTWGGIERTPNQNATLPWWSSYCCSSCAANFQREHFSSTTLRFTNRFSVQSCLQ